MLSDLIFRLRALFARQQVDHEIDEELRFHLDRQVEVYQKAGLDHAEAIRRARLEFGGLDQVSEEYRDALGVRLVDDLTKDVRLALRSLRATPVVAAVAIVSLALAIGANTAIFSVLNALLLRSLPVQHSDRLVLVTDSAASPRARSWDYPTWEQIRQRPHFFDAAAAWSFTRFNVAPAGESQFVEGIWASGGFFEMLGVPPVIGRTFSELDDQRNGGPDGSVAVISHGYWQRHFRGAADVIGRTVRLNAVPFTIVGVTPADFFGPEVGRTFDVIVPLRTESLVRGGDSALDAPGTNFLTVMARLEPDQSAEAAARAPRAVQSEIRQATIGPWRLNVSQDQLDRYLKSPFALIAASTGYSNLRGTYVRSLYIIAAVVALVLLIACVNIANLLLARAVARRHELSVRRALGASPWRLARQLLMESLVLSCTGAALGMLLAAYSSHVLVQQLSTPANVVFLDVSLDARILVFTIAVAAGTALLFGTAPAFRAARAAPIDALKQQGRATAEVAHGGLIGWLMIAQIALSLVLVVAAGLFIRSFISLSNRELGFRPASILVVTIDAERAGVDPAERIPLYGRIRDAIHSLPNVAEAAVSFLTPISGGGLTPPIKIGDSLPEGIREEVFGNLISPAWFDTFRTPVVRGRDFTANDRRGAPTVAIVNQTFVRKFLGDVNPIGRTMTLLPNTPRTFTVEIVGVAADAVYTSPKDPVPPTWYVPMAQFDMPGFPFESVRLSVRPKAGSPLSMTKSIAGAVASVNPRLALTFQPLAQEVQASLTQERLMAQVAGVFGVLALVLAALGLYGVTAYAISRRRTEIGIRMALGAAPRGVIRLVLRRVALLIAAGTTLGVCVSFWASKFVGGLIYGVPVTDRPTFLAAVVLLAAIGVTAGWLPARRAAHIDPVAVLRET